MRMIASIFFALSLLLAAGSAQAQQGCKDKTKATLTGTIATIHRLQPVPGETIWEIKAAGKIDGGCSVNQIWGDGNAPKTCATGKKFSATGEIHNAHGVWVLYSSSVTCQ